MYSSMGGKSLNIEATKTLDYLQYFLSKVIDELVLCCMTELGSNIKDCCVNIRLSLLEINSFTDNRLSIDKLNAPLIEILHNKLSHCSKLCEKTVLKRVLKQLWKLVMKNLENIVILPPMPQGNILNSILNSKIEEAYRFLMGSITLKSASERCLTDIQCHIMEYCLEQIKTFFHSNGDGLKKHFFEKSAELYSLCNTLSLYTQTTDSLIKTFVQTQNDQNTLMNHSRKFGEISVYFDFFTHPKTGKIEVKVQIKGAELNWRTKKFFHPYVECTLIGPNLNRMNFQFKTKIKGNTFSPIFNETFQFIIDQEESIMMYELHLNVKDYCFAREDHVIGVHVLKLADLYEFDSCARVIPLGAAVNVDSIGLKIINILLQKNNDVIASEFVKTKLAKRYILKNCERKSSE
jgi:protein unc-13 A/B/C